MAAQSDVAGVPGPLLGEDDRRRSRSAGIENGGFELASPDAVKRASSEPADYREALSSLLWEPYECREPRKGELATPQPSPPRQQVSEPPQEALRAGTDCALCWQCCGQCNVEMRTFCSTEAQTDDAGDVLSNNRERRRRRERRERRRNHINAAQTPVLEAATVPPPGAERLPDILNSHLPPPYSTLPLPPPVPVAVPATPGSPPHVRFPGFHISPAARRRSRRAEEEPKSCCGLIVTQTVSIRWFIVLIAFVGMCCAVVGTVLGAMKASGREHLTVSLLMIGVGIVLITVSGVAWRLTAHDAPSCRMMLGLGGPDEIGAEPNRRFVPRLPPSYGRPHHPYAAMMYPEFQYRPPPPSYQASMQEYRLRLLLLDRAATGGGHAVSPPPTYRSNSGSTLRAPLGIRREVAQSDYSRPPSYRSRTSSTRPSLDPSGPPAGPSEPGGAVVSVISVNEPLKLPTLPPERDVLVEGKVTIVTVSGSTSAPTPPPDTEMEILAHL